MKTTEVEKILRDGGVPFDSIRKAKGNYIIRKGYFYKMGMTTDKIVGLLKVALPNAIIVNQWDKFTSFRGGSSLANSSHFGVEFSLNNHRP
jgi:hypothetical protein